MTGIKCGPLRPEHVLYVRSMGKALRVTALFDSDDAANRYMETHRDQGVVAVISGAIMLAYLYDKGVTIPRD